MSKLPKSRQKSLLTILVAAFLLLFFSLNMHEFLLPSLADDVNIEVDIVNSPPQFVNTPRESVISSATNPTNAGDDITFETTATDADGEDYYLIVCSQPGAIPNDGIAGEPTCAAGNIYCSSSATTTGVEATCEHATTSGDPQSNDWYASICDLEICIDYEPELSLDEETPFIVNHAPNFTANGATANANPGGTITFTTTASDPNTVGTNDTVKLFICSTNSATSSGCAATTYCSAGLTASNPTCNYNIPSVNAPGINNYYAFIYDNHNMAAASSRSGTFSVNNVAPVVTNVATDIGSSTLTLTESSNTDVVLTATITDNNSCQNILDYKALAFLMEEAPACEDEEEGNYDPEQCVSNTAVNCSISSGNLCTGPTDPSMDIECTIAFPHYSEATVSGSRFAADIWWIGAKAYDTGTAGENHVEVEIDMLAALNVTSSINYGSLNANQNTGATNQSTIISPTGNVGLDVEISGTNMINGANTIPVGNQRYSTSTFTYPSGTALSSSPANVEVNIPKPTPSLIPFASVYWGLGTPAIIAAGTYSGTNYITGVVGETAQW